MSFNSLWGATWTAAWQMGQAPLPKFRRRQWWCHQVSINGSLVPSAGARTWALPAHAGLLLGREQIPSPSCRQAAPPPPSHQLILLLHPQPSANGEASSFQADLYGGVPAVLRFQGGWEMLYQTCHTADEVSKKELDLQRETRQTIYKTAHGTSLWTWVSHRKQPNE